MAKLNEVQLLSLGVGITHKWIELFIHQFMLTMQQNMINLGHNVMGKISIFPQRDHDYDFL